MSVLSALAAMSALRWVHNDVKPDNILCSSDGEVKLSDFGCAKRMDSVGVALTGAVGSVEFQAYEKRFLSPVRYTTKADVYSVGIVIAECANGSHCVFGKGGEGNGNGNGNDPNESAPYSMPKAIENGADRELV